MTNRTTSFKPVHRTFAPLAVTSGLRSLTCDDYLHYKVAIPDELKKRMEDIFGQLKLKYTEKDILGYAPRLGKDGTEWSFKTPYRIVTKDGKGLVYIFTNPVSTKEEICHIHFDGPDRFWVYVEDRGWKEFFERSTK